ncbi:MAG TPA: hypothetical protein VH601_01235 [Bryobacteraceae bacterium]|jgi:hypothetical protein
MAKSDANEIVGRLLKRYGRTFAEELSIDTKRNEPSLFRILISALLFSMRISQHIALKSAASFSRAVGQHQRAWLGVRGSSVLRALDEGGYVRYDLTADRRHRRK